jgi:hypothetical protein
MIRIELNAPMRQFGRLRETIDADAPAAAPWLSSRKCRLKFLASSRVPSLNGRSMSKRLFHRSARHRTGRPPYAGPTTLRTGPILPRPRPAAPVLAIAAVLGACESSTAPRVPTTLELEPQTVELEWGRWNWPDRVTALVRDQNGVPFASWPQGLSLTWTVADPAVSTLAEHLQLGVVRVRAVNGGQTVITAQAGDLPPRHVPIHVRPAPDTLQGELSFRYTGDHAGEFVAAGIWPFDANDPDILFTIDYLRDQRAWVVSEVGVSLSLPPPLIYRGISARRIRANGVEDHFSITVEGWITAPGTYAGTAHLNLGVDRRQAAVGIEAHYWAEDDATLTFTAVSEARVAGTFSFGMIRVPGIGNIQVIEGTFDAPLVRFNRTLW